MKHNSSKSVKKAAENTKRGGTECQKQAGSPNFLPGFWKPTENQQRMGKETCKNRKIYSQDTTTKKADLPCVLTSLDDTVEHTGRHPSEIWGQLNSMPHPKEKWRQMMAGASYGFGVMESRWGKSTFVPLITGAKLCLLRIVPAFMLNHWAKLRWVMILWPPDSSTRKS